MLPISLLSSSLQAYGCVLPYLLQEIRASPIIASGAKPHASMLRCDVQPGDSHSASWLVVPKSCEELHLHMQALGLSPSACELLACPGQTMQAW